MRSKRRNIDRSSSAAGRRTRALALATGALLLAGLVAAAAHPNPAGTVVAMQTRGPDVGMAVETASASDVPVTTAVGSSPSTTVRQAVARTSPPAGVTPPTVIPPTVEVTTPPVPEPTVPPTTVPPADACAAARGGVFAPAGSGLYAVDAVTSAAIALAPGFWIGRGSWSPAGDQIVFSGRESGQSNGAEPTTLWIVNADGTNRRRVAADAAYPEQPSWSPDGKTIAFYSSPYDPTTGSIGLYLLDLTDGTSTRIAWVDGGRFTIEWAPDGKRLALAAPNLDAVQVVEVATGMVRDHAVSADAYEVSWSRDGAHLAVSDLHGPVRIMNADGTNARVVVDDGRYARWSPTADRLAVWRNFDAHIYDVATGADRRIATNADPIGWSRDGRVVQAAIGVRRIDAIDLATSCTRVVVQSEGIDVSGGEWAPTSNMFLVVAETTAHRRY